MGSNILIIMDNIEKTIRELVKEEIEAIFEGSLVVKASSELSVAKEKRNIEAKKINKAKSSNASAMDLIKLEMGLIDAEKNVNDSARKVADASDKELDLKSRELHKKAQETKAGEPGSVADERF